MPQRSRYIEGHKLQELFDTAASFGKYTNEGFRTIPCSPDFVGVIGQVYEEGEDYKIITCVCGVNCHTGMPFCNGYCFGMEISPLQIAIPIKKEESQDELWEELQKWCSTSDENISDKLRDFLKSKFHITRKQ